MLEGLTGTFADGMDWEWPHGHDNDKSNSNSKGKCGGPSTTLRSGRDDAVFEGGLEIGRTGNDNSNNTGKMRGPSTSLRSGRDDAVFEGGLELGRTGRGVGGVEGLISRIDSLFVILLRG